MFNIEKKKDFNAGTTLCLYEPRYKNLVSWLFRHVSCSVICWQRLEK